MHHADVLNHFFNTFFSFSSKKQIKLKLFKVMFTMASKVFWGFYLDFGCFSLFFLGTVWSICLKRVESRGGKKNLILQQRRVHQSIAFRKYYKSSRNLIKQLLSICQTGLNLVFCFLKFNFKNSTFPSWYR